MPVPMPEQVEAMRTLAGLSRQELADMLGVTRMAVWYWEVGQRPMTHRDWKYMRDKIMEHVAPKSKKQEN